MSIHDIPDEVLRRGDTNITFLCQMDFRSDPLNWWLGYGPLTAGGVTYQGTGDAIKVGEIAISYGMSAGMIRFEVSAASPKLIALTDNSEDEVNGRRCQFFYQLYSMGRKNDDGTEAHRGALIGEPLSMFVGRMRDLRSRSSAENREVELEVYGRLSSQGKPPYGRWTDGDQKARYPGDRGMEFMPGLREKSVTWFKT